MLPCLACSAFPTPSLAPQLRPLAFRPPSSLPLSLPCQRLAALPAITILSDSAGQTTFPTNPPAGSEITSLPGYAGRLPSRHFGGYVDIADDTKHFYYYLALSTSSPATDPVVLW